MLNVALWTIFLQIIKLNFRQKVLKCKNLIGGENAQLSHPDNNQVRAAGISSMRSPINKQIIPNP